MTAEEPGSSHRTVRLRQDVLAWRFVDEEVVALDVVRSTYLGVNRTGAVLWSALAEGATPQQLLSLILNRFDVEPDQAARDIDSLLADLHGRGLLEEVRPS